MHPFHDVQLFCNNQSFPERKKILFLCQNVAKKEKINSFQRTSRDMTMLPLMCIADVLHFFSHPQKKSLKFNLKVVWKTLICFRTLFHLHSLLLFIYLLEYTQLLHFAIKKYVKSLWIFSFISIRNQMSSTMQIFQQCINVSRILLVSQWSLTEFKSKFMWCCAALLNVGMCKQLNCSFFIVFCCLSLSFVGLSLVWIHLSMFFFCVCILILRGFKLSRSVL